MTLFDEEMLQRSLGLESGDRYSDEDFNLAVFDRVQGLYMDRGYIYSRIEPEITPVGEDSLDIHFVLTENHKVYINHIAIKGNTRTRENVIRRQLRVFPGDVFNRGRLMRSHREVMMLNFFANVVPDVVPVSEDKVDLEIIVEEKPAGQANANMGYTQSYGMTGGGGLALPNFRGKGQSLNLSFNVGTNYNMGYNLNADRPKYQSASISFTDPMVNDTKNLIGGSLFYTFRGRSSMYSAPIDYTMAGSSVTWGRIFKWPDDFFRGTWSFQIVRKMYEGSQADLDRYAGGKKTSDGINFSQTIRRDSRDHPEFSTMGSLFSLKSTLSGWILRGDENFHKHKLNLEWYTPTFWKFVLMNSMKIGVVKELPAVKEGTLSFIPWNDRFIMGGNGIPYGNPLRGYDDNRVGPLTSSGSPIGGNTMVKFGTEFRVPFAENPVVYGLLFAEMGNVWSSTDLMERLSLPRSGPFDMKRSAGAGIRFFMPMIGMLGFDIGYGFDRIPEPGWKTTLTFGQQF
jgi:outer membrane protein insertion porin family